MAVTLFTMTYYGSQMVVKNYNVMGVAKAALGSRPFRYIAAEGSVRKAFVSMRSRRGRLRLGRHREFPNSTN